MNSLKIAYIIGGLPFGGVERWLYDLNVRLLGVAGVEARVFNLSGTGLLRAEYEQAGIRVIDVGRGKRALSSFRLDTVRKLRRLLKNYAPGLIHTMHYSANHLGRFASLGLGAPVIVHLHNTKREKKFIRRLSDKLLSHATDLYLGVSQAVAETIAQDHNRAGKPAKVLYNAIEPARFDCAPLDVCAEFGVARPALISTGRYVPQKNMDLLIRAVGILRERGLYASLLLAGEGPERPRLEAEVKRLGLEDRVRLIGFRNDVGALYRGCDIFAMPSDFEGFLIAQLEAMYCGLPCVVSDQVPALEIAGGSSLICEREAGDIADKLQKIIEDAELRQYMSAQGKRIAGNHTMERYVETLLNIYKELLPARAC